MLYKVQSCGGPRREERGREKGREVLIDRMARADAEGCGETGARTDSRKGSKQLVETRGVPPDMVAAVARSTVRQRTEMGGPDERCTLALMREGGALARGVMLSSCRGRAQSVLHCIWRGGFRAGAGGRERVQLQAQLRAVLAPECCTAAAARPLKQ